MKNRVRLVIFLLFICMFACMGTACRSVDLTVGTDGTAPADVVTGYPVIFRQIYCTGDNCDTPVRYSFIELYNTADHPISLRGKSLQYARRNQTDYCVYPFTDDAVIPAESAFLVRCAEAVDEDGTAYIDACEKFLLTKYDADFPELTLSAKRTRLILADTDQPLSDADGLLLQNRQVLAYFAACADGETLYAPVNAFGLNKTTAVRRSQTLDSWETVDYAAQSCLSITQYTPYGIEGQNTAIPLSGVDVVFSADSGRYDRAVDVSLATLSGYEILYTLDCSDGYSSFHSYQDAIHIADTATETCGDTAQLLVDKYGTNVKPRRRLAPAAAVVRACAYDGKNYGPVVTRTYFVMPDMAEYDDILLINITVDPNDFTGKDGIYAIVSDDIFAPRERCDGYMEIFSPDGDDPVGRYVQLRMNGNGSLAFCQKSMRVYMREEDTPLNGDTLQYDLFSGDAQDGDGVPITAFKTFLMRNSGNDASCLHMRDALMQRLSRSVDAEIQAYRPSLLFINGEFWGLYNLRERYDAAYFSAHYGVLPENLVMLESVSPLLTGSWNTPYIVNEGVLGDEQDFYDIVDYVAAHDMKDDEAVAWVEARMDLDNFIDFFAASCYLANTDWPGNNIKVWRVKNENDPSGRDTRWRWVLADMDFGVGHSTSAEQPMFAHALTEDTVCGKLMTRLLKNAKFRMRFADRALELCSSIYQPEETLDVLDDMIHAVAPYIEYNFTRWRGDNGSMSSWQRHIDRTRDFLENRTVHFVRQLGDALRLSPETVIVSAQHATVSILTDDGQEYHIQNEEKTLYFRDSRVLNITVTLDEGYALQEIKTKVGPRETTWTENQITLEVYARTMITVLAEK